MMFVDTSAVVAVVLREPLANRIELLIERTETVVTSPMVRLEASIVIAERLDISLVAAETHFNDFLTAGNIGMLPITNEIGMIAVEAYGRFGKGRDPAKLNLADCFSYAVAKSLGLKILFVGNDFSKTDLKSAL
jgi:ribonuclease VapC